MNCLRSLSSWQWVARVYLLSEIDELFAVRRKNCVHLTDKGGHDTSRPLDCGFQRKKIVAEFYGITGALRPRGRFCFWIALHVQIFRTTLLMVS